MKQRKEKIVKKLGYGTDRVGNFFWTTDFKLFNAMKKYLGIK